MLAQDARRRAADVAILVETVAGDVAQVDSRYVGQLYDATVGRLRKAWVFVLVLAPVQQAAGTLYGRSAMAARS
jgi:hypothetical protein